MTPPPLPLYPVKQHRLFLVQGSPAVEKLTYALWPQEKPHERNP